MAYPPFDLTGKTAVVTGGNSGIGLGFADALAAAGADVCIWGTNESKNRAALQRLGAHGHRVAAKRCDVGEPQQIADAFAETVAQFGRVDACFANAGVGSRGTPFLEMTYDEWRRIFQINLDGVFFLFQAAVAHMKEQGGGSLVATSSSAAVFGAPRSEHYAATKAGLIAIIRGLAVEFARYGIRANAVLPGWIETAMTERAMSNEKFEERVQRRIPMRRWGQPEDFGGIAVYLASDASRFHTGDSMMIDGGYACF